ncbi:hypothetical protein CFAM422_010040 [Trichoderma lentiforme]|uniref:Uncharacterized protein n=1 Tax=Trichoderma lentiforme TaxID=1567552 RepID=A0A9P5CB40_9HYPO|nr:hypothetical protein CFAM422_010040 [Trichoderma lentiforme]
MSRTGAVPLAQSHAAVELDTWYQRQSVNMSSKCIWMPELVDSWILKGVSSLSLCSVVLVYLPEMVNPHEHV